MKPFVSKARIGLLLIFLVTASSVLMACEPTLYITVHNQTDETIQIFFDGETFIDKAIPGGEVKFKTAGIFSHYNVTAKDLDGNVVYSANFTRDDVKGKKTHDVYFPPKETKTENSDNVTGE